MLTQPDRPCRPRPAARAQRGQEARAGARARRLPAANAEGRRARIARLAAARPDVLVVAAYGLLLPPRALDDRAASARSTSMLRCCRAGAARRRSSARCLPATAKPGSHHADGRRAGYRAGALAAIRWPSREDDDAQSLHDKLAALGARGHRARARAILPRDARSPCRSPRPAPPTRARSARRTPRLDWSRPCAELERRVRALRPAPGARIAACAASRSSSGARSCVAGQRHARGRCSKPAPAACWSPAARARSLVTRIAARGRNAPGRGGFPARLPDRPPASALAPLAEALAAAAALVARVAAGRSLSAELRASPPGAWRIRVRGAAVR